ncbi:MULTISPECIES: hypothetical protein [unclassified Myxococcus]|uniref:hypothetical protein n=1 Tax=unclassified Myxococcus TaxID=2648731 RepID=UPI0020CE09DE|nr:MULTISPECIES: hypothetical protein [unclassified Myxococcus]
MFRRSVAAVSALIGVLGTGCASVSHVQTADTLGEGRFQVGIEPGVMGAAVLGDDEGVSAAGYVPHFDLAIRYGVSERVDLGVRLGSSLAELQSKFLLTQPNDPVKAISLAPSISGASIGTGTGDDGESASTSYLNVAVPLLVGFKTKGGSELVLGPRAIWTRVAGSAGDDGAAINIISVGASVGYALRVTEGFRLMPEVGLSFPIVGEVNSTGTDSEAIAGFNGGFAQFKLGFLFGAGRPVRRGPDILPPGAMEETDHRDDSYRASERAGEDMDH